MYYLTSSSFNNAPGLPGKFWIFYPDPDFGGEDVEGKGMGQPVLQYRKPVAGRAATAPAILGKPFIARMGRWVGAQMGLFVTNGGHADIDYFRVTP